MKILPTVTVLATLALVGGETSGSTAGAGEKPPKANSGAAATGGKPPAASSNVAGIGDIPPTGVQACMGRADNLWNAKPGKSVAIGGNPTDQGFWALQMTTGNLQSTCTVTPLGNVINIGPTYNG